MTSGRLSVGLVLKVARRIFADTVGCMSLALSLICSSLDKWFLFSEFLDVCFSTTGSDCLRSLDGFLYKRFTTFSTSSEEKVLNAGACWCLDFTGIIR